MIQRPYRVGRSCEAWCTRCKSESEHTIVAMVDGLPRRVECTTCHSQHNYRLPPGSRQPARKSASGTRRIGRKEATLDRLLSSPDPVEARLYRMSERFEANQVMEHPIFGIGIVQEALPGDKIEVLFKSGKKLLVHGR